MIEYILAGISIFLSLLYSVGLGILVWPKKEAIRKDYSPPVSVLLPAHNEERSIVNSIMSIVKAKYPSEREIIVINNGSNDKTGEIVQGLAKKYKYVKLFNLGHIGKAAALNFGARKAKYAIIVTLDADSEIENESLIHLVQPLADEKIGGVSGIVRAKKSINPFTWFQDFEYIISSSWRYIATKINANSYLPGFSAFKKEAFFNAGGFKTDTLTEDFDIAVDLRETGFYTVTVKEATMFTEVPTNLKSFLRQRMRWGRGNVQVIRKHSKFLLSKKSGWLGKFSLPNHVYWHIHALLYIPIILYMMFGDYFKYFALQNNFISFGVLKYFFAWLSMFGMVEMFVNLGLGAYKMNIFLATTILAFSLSVVFNMYALFKITKPRLYHIAAFFFFPIYTLINLSAWGFSFIYELSRPKVFNRWVK